MKITDIRKIDRSKLPNEDVKGLYDILSKDTDGFNEDFIELLGDEILEFLKIIKAKVPEAIVQTEKIVRQPLKKAEKPIDFEDDDVIDTVMEDYNLTRDKAVKLIALRKEAFELKKENIDKLLDRLDKSEFYEGKNSKAPIDKGRTRDLGKDSKQGAITLAEERKMTGRPFKRISKAGGKNQYGTTEGGKVYYEYRMNRRDVDNKILLENGGGIERLVGSFYYDKRKDKTFRIIYSDKNKIQIIYFDKQKDEEGKHIDVSMEDFKYLTEMGAWAKYMQPYFKDGGGVGIPNADKMQHLPYEISIYVPSTRDVDKNISATEFRARVKEVQQYLSTTFGGFTSAEKVGGYLSNRNSIITDKVISVTSFASMQSFRDNKLNLVNKLSIWAKKWGQEAIGFEFEGDLYYVPQKFVSGGKLKATYIPNRDIKLLTTIWGNNIKGKDLLDGAYTTRKNIKTEPKMARTMFEDEMFEFNEGGSLASLSYYKFIKYRYDYYKKSGYETTESYDTAFRDLGLELNGRIEKDKFDEALKVGGLPMQRAWNNYKKESSIVVEKGIYVNPYQLSYKKGGKTKPKDLEVVRGFFDDEPYEFENGGFTYKINTKFS